MSDAFLEHPPVRHVAACLAAAGHPHAVIALADTARSAAEAAAVLGVREEENEDRECVHQPRAQVASARA